MYFSFESLNFPGHFMRHRNFLGELSRVESDLDRSDATFQLGGEPRVGDRVSFRSVNFPLHVLRHQDFRIKLHEWNPPLMPPGGSEAPDQQLLRADATFILRQGNAGPEALSFEASNFPGLFIRHRNFELFVEKVGPDDEVASKDSTFFAREPFAPPPPVSLG